MSEDKPAPKLHIDSDWKNEAQHEKERLVEQEEQQPAGGAAALGKPTFRHLLDMIVMQAMVGLGGMRAPNGEVIPPDLEAGRYYIDLLGVIEEKTKGNLSADEQRVLTAVLHDLRGAYVQLVTAATTGNLPPQAPE
ncbi:MAG: DUF1844 domain-containing protein [Dehalococcoidia bacterium]|nr:DUF1844 domain-containing protein [Dehalococcoidia bacterium]